MLKNYRLSVAIPSIQVGFFTSLQEMIIKVCAEFVAIPSIQVGFFTLQILAVFSYIADGCRNPFYSGRFFHSQG